MREIAHTELLAQYPECALLLDEELAIRYSNGRAPHFPDGLPDELRDLVSRFFGRTVASEERMLPIGDSGQMLQVKLARIQEEQPTLALLCVRDVTADTQLEEKMLQRSEELSILYEITALETERLSKDVIIDQVALKLLELTALEEALIVERALPNDKGPHVRVVGEEDGHPAWLEKFLAGETSVEVLNDARARIWRADRELSAVPAALLAAGGFGICVRIPIIVRGEMQAVLLLLAGSTAPVRVHDNLRFFDMIARQLGGALERAELFYALEKSFREIDEKNRQLAGQLQLAQKLQTGILEIQFPRRPELEFAVKYIPSYHLGGDFYDVFELPDQRVGVLIADVCGHGVSSALVTTFLKAAARDLSQDPVDAAQLLNSLNQKLLPILPLGMFVSAFYLVIDTAARILHFSNGGHPLPFYFESEADRVSELAVEGRLLSIGRDSVYSTRSVSYAPGDKVFLFTDGLYEIENPEGDLLGEDHVRDVIFEHRALAAKTIVEQLMSTVYAFAGTHELKDDVNVIGIDLVG